MYLVKSMETERISCCTKTGIDVIASVNLIVLVALFCTALILNKISMAPAWRFMIADQAMTWRGGGRFVVRTMILVQLLATVP